MEVTAMCRAPRANAGEIARALARSIGEAGQVAALAADLDAPIVARVVALAALVDAIAVTDAAWPDATLDALDDLALVDAAAAGGHARAVIAALHAFATYDELVTTRRRVVRRLVATGAGGLPLASLAFGIGDRAAAAGVAARDFAGTIAARVPLAPRDPIAGAWAGWLARLSDDDAAAVLAARADAAEVVLPHANRGDRERVARLAERMLARP